MLFVGALAAGARDAASSPGAAEARAPAPAHASAPQDAAPLAPEARAFWEATWSRLDKADRTTRRETSWRRLVNDLTDVAAERRIVGLSRDDEQDQFRTRLLQWHLERLKGRREDPIDPPRAPVAWLPSEPWFAARALKPGPVRCSAMMLALDEERAPDRGARLALAERQAREELAAADARGAALLAERVDEAEPTTDRLALRAWALAQAGRASDAHGLVAARTRSATDGPDEPRLRVIAAEVGLAQGDDLAARADLGAALGLASPDGAVLAARLLSSSGEHRRARILTRAWIESPGARDVPGALWALACLAAPPAGTLPGTPTGVATPVR